MFLEDDAKSAPSPDTPTADEIVESIPDDDSEEAKSEKEAKSVPFHRDPRWQKVYGERKQFKQEAEKYKAHGSPEEVQEKLNRLAYYDRMVEQADAEREVAKAEGRRPKLSDDEKAAEAKREQIRKELREIEPGLKRLDDYGKAIEAHVNSIQARAWEATGDLVTDSGLPVNDENQRTLATILEDVILADQKLTQRYASDPEGALKRAFEKFQKTSTHFRTAAERTAKAKVLKDKEAFKNLPATSPRTGGGGPSVKQSSDEPKDVKESTDRFLEALQGLAKG